MKKILYVSDLDGTLLTPDGTLSAYTKTFLCNFIAQGGLFSIATARNIQQARRLMGEIPLNIPIIVNNGLGVYDLQQKQFCTIHSIPKESLTEIPRLGKQKGFSVFLYALQKDEITLFYLPLQDEGEKYYLQKRMRQYPNRCIPVAGFQDIPPDCQPLYMIVYGEKEKVSLAQEALISMDGIYGVASEDVYSTYYFLDIIPAKASKANGVQTLKKLIGASEIVAFGDNYNDIDMLLAADRSYVPQNGVEDAKKAATGTISSNQNDGVARFIENEWRTTKNTGL